MASEQDHQMYLSTIRSLDNEIFELTRNLRFNPNKHRLEEMLSKVRKSNMIISEVFLRDFPSKIEEVIPYMKANLESSRMIANRIK